MRVSISMGLLALSMTWFSSSAVAGNVEECEFLKDGNYTKGLYGLCNAYHNAGNEKAKANILKNYNKKAGPGDPPMPGTEEEVACPCWDEDNLAAASAFGTPSACLESAADVGVDLAIYTSAPAYYQFFTDDTSCFRLDPNGGGDASFYATAEEWAEERATCRAGIQSLVEMDFGTIICNGIPQ